MFDGRGVKRKPSFCPVTLLVASPTIQPLELMPVASLRVHPEVPVKLLRSYIAPIALAHKKACESPPNVVFDQPTTLAPVTLTAPSGSAVRSLQPGPSLERSHGRSPDRRQGFQVLHRVSMVQRAACETPVFEEFA